ncbi:MULTISPECIES: GNAT family N-acetyltransferase [Nocardiopsis]|uniref:GNAT family N-acetyltransferase n=1 Tax=Nocardiopsis alba TaxID=53437 RepID=A0A7K2IU68_9ACTN|nr:MULTISPECIES: GNAT family N-acetyltransferase [Nocardiopsis]MEC3894723.1 GNAT family N-acetyltransferase [Nocardiopsis sp. LDBS1602]MYR33473.1 GNAT family N-acetyltransferase [Nocardiopsis alba]
MYRLREWNRGDADRLLEAFAWRELAWQETEVPRTPDEAMEWIDRRAVLTKEEIHGFAVVDGLDKVLGHVQISVTSRRHELGWLSFWTHPAEQGRGVATAGARLASRFAFDELGLFRVEAGHRIDNPGSCVALGRAGLLPEGIERAKLLYGTSRYDTASHARLVTDPEEWTPEGPCKY